MKSIYKNFKLFFIFFIILLFKDSVYGLMTNNIPDIKNTIQETENNYYKDEYQKILNTYDMNLPNNYNYELSKVLYRDIYDFYNEITILKGSDNKIKKGSAVINEFGLIGVVKRVNTNSSIVSLITNSDSEISVMVNNVYGILKHLNNKLIITSINNYEDIEIGDIVYTSDIGHLPEGIKIGEITKVNYDNAGIEKKIIVSPFVNFDDLKYVAILNGGL